jgi:hypothetical protein
MSPPGRRRVICTLIIRVSLSGYGVGSFKCISAEIPRGYGIPGEKIVKRVLVLVSALGGELP